MTPTEFHVLRAAEIRERSADEPSWLVEPLWGAGAVGIIGGAPKSCKTWLALEMAVAVASGQPALGRFSVPQPGPVLVFAAEDAPAQVRERLEHLSRARGVDFSALDVRLIVEASLRLDRPVDVARLRATVDRHRPKLLVLDPYVRLQRADENDARQVSAILSALRELSRSFSTAVALVHHARKHGADLPGQALRGSGDFHAWGDSNLYVSRRRGRIVLTIEHRAAASPKPVALELVEDGGPVCLSVREAPPDPPEVPLAQRIVALLQHDGTLPKDVLRRRLRVRNQHLTETLRDLETSSRIARTTGGWRLSPNA